MSRNWKIRIAIGLVIVAFAYFQRCSRTEENPYTGREQAIALNAQDEIALGLQSAPQMIQEYGGLYQNQELQDQVDYVGQKLVRSTVAKDSPINLISICWQMEKPSMPLHSQVGRYL